LKVLDIMLKDAKKYIGDVLRIEVNYFYFFWTKSCWETW
jgi:hypothetical protein